MKQNETIRSLWVLTAGMLTGARRVAMLLATMLLTMTAQTAWADSWTEAGGTGGTGTSENPYFVNMPVTGEETVTIPSGITSFKVYDDGGKDGNYSNSCTGYLVLTAPEGYVLQLSGTIKVEGIERDLIHNKTVVHDHLTVYNGSTTSSSKLHDKVSSGDESGGPTDIGIVNSSGRSMMLYFYSDKKTNYAGLDLTVTVTLLATTNNINVTSGVGGSIVAKVGETTITQAKLNDVVTLTVNPESGYLLSCISVKDAGDNIVPVNWVSSNTATFTMPALAVTVTPTFTSLGNLYINMPTTGTREIIIPSGVTSFKVYDDGGKDGNYSVNCSGTLVLTAPTGYILQLSGNIMSNIYDNLTVYDNGAASGPKLIDAVSSSNTGEQTAIPTVVSSGQNMTIYFYPFYRDLFYSLSYAGLDLTVELVSSNTESGITVNSATGGSVTTDKATAKVNATVTLTANPESGYMLSDISVKDASDNAVNVTWDVPFGNTATFKMPLSAVTVTPVFTNTWTADGGLYINMPKTGTTTVTIPEGVTSFKVYDDGGNNGNYSKDCDGTLVLTAPEGHIFQLSGNIANDSYAKLTVYDNNAASGTKLIDAVSSSNAGYQTAIATVISSGQSMTLYFESSSIDNYAGLDLMVRVIDRNAGFNINGIGIVTGGTITATVGGAIVTTARPGDVVTLDALPESGYVLGDLSVTDADNHAVPVDWDMCANTATFIMSGSAVTVTPTFTNDLSINMPAKGTKTFNIATTITSFKVYDNGGKDGVYSNGCTGKLVLTAPEGYVLQLSGSVMTEEADKLTVYDGSTEDSPKLADGVHGASTVYEWRVTPANIAPVTSSGQSMTLYFSSDPVSRTFEGLDLTVNVVKQLAGNITFTHIADQTYTGSAITPAVTVMNGTTDITDQCNFAYSNNVNTGSTATVTITDKTTSNNLGSMTFNIVPATTNPNIVNTGATQTITLTHDENGIMVTLAGASEGGFSITADVDATDVKLNRTFESGQKTTICLPFAVSDTEAAALGKFYQFKSINGEGKIEMEEVTTGLEANKPYVFEPKSNQTLIDFCAKTLKAGGPQSVVSGFTFKGIDKRVKWTTDTRDPLYDATLAGELGKAYGFALKDITVGTTAYQKGQFVKLGSGANSRAFRAYLLSDGTWDGQQPAVGAARTRSAASSLPDVIDIVWIPAQSRTTGISTVGAASETDGWFSLDGRKLDGKPTKKGLYINNGKKVVIK